MSESVAESSKDLVLYTSIDSNIIEEYLPLIIEEKMYFQNEPCDVILFTNGDEVEAIVFEVGTKEIRYKKCGFKDGPTIVVERNDVFMIKYRDGSKDLIEPYEEPTTQSNENNYQNKSYVQSSSNQEKTEGLAIASMILGILALVSFYFSFVFAILGLIFGKNIIDKVAYGKLKEGGQSHKFAKVGIILSAIAIALWILILLVLI